MALLRALRVLRGENWVVLASPLVLCWLRFLYSKPSLHPSVTSGAPGQAWLIERTEK
jgi:hypothetical protein